MSDINAWIYPHTNNSVVVRFPGKDFTGHDVEFRLYPFGKEPATVVLSTVDSLLALAEPNDEGKIDGILIPTTEELLALAPEGKSTLVDAIDIVGEHRQKFAAGTLAKGGPGEFYGLSLNMVEVPGIPGPTPDISIGTVETLPAGSEATVALDETSTPAAPVINFGLPAGNTGATPNLTLLTGDTLPAGEDAAVREAPGSTPEAPSFYLDLPAGVTPDITIGSVTTLAPGQPATVTLAPESTPAAPILIIGIPQGAQGIPGVPGDVSIVDLVASRSIAVTDKAAVVRNPDATARSVTYGLDLPAGFWHSGLQYGAGAVTLVAGSGVTFWPAGEGTVTLGAGAAWQATVLSNTGAAAVVWLTGDLI